MLAESQIKRFVRKENPEEYQQILEFAEKNGHTPFVIEDSIILDTVPPQYVTLVHEKINSLHKIGQTNPFKYFILSGFHQLRYKGDEMILCGVYDFDEESYKKATEEK